MSSVLWTWLKRFGVTRPQSRLVYPERTIPKTFGELTDKLAVAELCLSTRKFPTGVDGRPYYNFEGIFYSLGQGIQNLRRRLGNATADQLLDMLAQAKLHHEEGWRLTRGKPPPKNKPRWWESPDAPTEMRGWWQHRIGNCLLQDMEMVIRKRKPWAYPKELYRWPTNPNLPELSEADLLKKDFDEDYEWIERPEGRA
jgi:hypothetical protein